MPLSARNSFRDFALKYILFIAFVLFAVSSTAQAPAISAFSPVSAPQFSTVTITGSNFTGTTAVKFGGIPAFSFFLLSSTQIWATVGAGASGDVTVTTANGTATKTGFTFIPKPVIQSFLPVNGSINTTVTIKGSIFTGATGVFFGNVSALSFTIVSDTVITAVVGAGSSGNVIVSGLGGNGFLSGFTHLGPSITSYTPLTGAPGTTVTLTGINFTDATVVRFGSIPASSFTVNSATSITAVTAPGSFGTIAVTTPLGIGTATGFNLPKISSFTPNSGTSGTPVTIRGRKFTDATAVYFGNITAHSFSVMSDTVINAVVGSGGSGWVKVSNSYGADSLGFFDYTYPPPTISSFTPTFGKQGDTITIRGTNLFTASVVIFGNSVASSVTNLSDTVIKAVVGPGASGNVTVSNPGGNASLPGFIFIGPTISSFSPSSAISGTVVTITGTNLTVATAVMFGGIPAASFIVQSSTTITAVVANGATGNVTVSTPLGTAISGGFKMVPIINTFSPVSGPIATILNINGSNFGTTAADNIVFFGAVKATILSANATQIVVTVPTGATYEPISVTTNNLIAYADKPFQVTFANDNTSITTNSFASKVDYFINQGGGDYGVYGSAIADLDDDGKPDMVIMKNISNIFYGFSVFRNTSINGIVNFAARQNFGYPLQNSSSVSLKDLDGDGKPDIFVTNGGGGSFVVSFYKNSSTPGSISFASKQDFTTGTNGGAVKIGDLDGDGKPDMVVANGNGSSTISVFRNTSAFGTISFAAKVDYVTGNLPYCVAIGDINADGKLDIAVANSSEATAVVLKNSSVIGTISFLTPVAFPIGIGAYDIKIADLEGDGKPDIVVSNSFSQTFSVLKNTGSAGMIAFAPKVDYTTGNTPYGFAVEDMDGDSRPDVVVANNDDNTVSIFKNGSNAGIISFAAMVNYPTGNQPRDVSIADLNGDGKPDMVTANWISYNASVLINKIGDSVRTDLCPPMANTTITADLIGSSYQWQLNTGSGFVNISNNSNYNGTNTVTLQLSAIPSFWAGYKYRCLVNGNYSLIFLLRFANNWTGASGTVWENPSNWSCGLVPDINTDVIINSGTIILNSSTTIRSLTLAPGVNFTVSTGAILTITH